jgi:cyclophilin family peptidyl-prolyl cis-trans isomerase
MIPAWYRAGGTALLLLAFGCSATRSSTSSSGGGAAAGDARAAVVDPVAPARYEVTLETTAGRITLEIHRDSAPRGADRLYHLVRAGVFDDSRFSRVVPGFIVQFGIPGDPRVSAVWKDARFPDDPVRGSNVRGTIAFAMTGPDTRTHQLFISLVDNTRLDTQGFSPLGRVTDGMDVVDRLYGGYGETSGGGMRAGRQQEVMAQGNVWLDANYPKLDRLVRARVRPR